VLWRGFRRVDLAGARSGYSISAESLCPLIGSQSRPDQYFRYDCYFRQGFPRFTNARISGKNRDF
jgi:hypothetical protein